MLNGILDTSASGCWNKKARISFAVDADLFLPMLLAAVLSLRMIDLMLLLLWLEFADASGTWMQDSRAPQISCEFSDLVSTSPTWDWK